MLALLFIDEYEIVPIDSLSSFSKSQTFYFINITNGSKHLLNLGQEIFPLSSCV